jgi:regulator of protease activity HflC (stomatin/prohibitin superfamily)
MALLPNVDRLPSGSTHPRKWIAPAIGVALLVFLLVQVNPLVQVSSGYAGVLTDFGSVQPVPLVPGLHFVIPFYQQVFPVSVQPQTVTSDETASTHDLQQVTTSIAVTFHVAPDSAPDFYQNFRDFDTLGSRIIAPAVSNDVKEVTANYDAEELVTKRDAVDEQIKQLIVASLAPYHLTVEAVNVSNFAFSEAYAQAIEQKQVAQQQALQAQYTLQQTQISAQQQVVQAKAQADAAVATAQGQAQALLLTSEAQAKANTLIAQSLTPTLLQQKALDKWDGTLPHYLTAGAPLPFIGTASSEQTGK